MFVRSRDANVVDLSWPKVENFSSQTRSRDLICHEELGAVAFEMFPS